jgi:hypothetical protein
MPTPLQVFQANSKEIIGNIDGQLHKLLRDFFAHVNECHPCRAEIFQTLNGDVPNAALCPDGTILFRDTNFQFHAQLEIRTKIDEAVKDIEQRENV